MSNFCLEPLSVADNRNLMRLFLLTTFTMIAFASNSLLTRMAIEPGYIDPISFALIRVLAGAVFLCAVVYVQSGPVTWLNRARLIGAVSLAVYMIGFSVAYVSLDAGLGALILFGVVQVAMFSFGAVTGQRPSPRQLIGASLAFAGLVVALWPTGSAPPDSAGAAAMILAGLGWAAYSLAGRTARNPLAATGVNFALCLPLLLVLTVPFIEWASPTGVVLAVTCGAVTSGLGYALWYSVLPDLQRNTAAIVQLSVPIIAILAGALVLGESVTVAIVFATLLVVSGIALAVTGRSAPKGRS